MENYMYFEDNELFEELVEQLKAKEYEIGVLNRCCEAYDMELQKARAEIEQVRQVNSNLLRSVNNLNDSLLKSNRSFNTLLDAYSELKNKKTKKQRT